MITVSKKLLIPALERCAHVAPSKGEPALLSHIKIAFDTRITYSVTNLVTSIIGSVEASGKPEQFTVNVRDLLAASKSVNGDDVKLSVKNSKLTVSGEGKRSFTYSVLSADDFPVVATDATEWVDLPGNTLRSLIERVMFAVGSESDERQNLKCVRVRALDGVLSAAGADGKALGYASDAIDSTASVTALTPRGCIATLLSVEADTVSMSASDKAISFRFGDEVMIARTIADLNSFPPIEAVLEQCNSNKIKTAAVNGQSVLESLSAIRRTNSRADIDLTFADGELKIENVTDDDHGYAVDIVSSAGSDTGDVRLSGEYLACALKGCANVTIGFGAELDPFIITDGMFTAILMPLRKK